MTNERIWESLVNFLSGLGGTDPVSMIHETPSYIQAVESYLKTDEAKVDIAKTSFYLGVFLGEYINQKYSGYWQHGENESLVIVGPDEDGMVYQTSSQSINIESDPAAIEANLNPFILAKSYLESPSGDLSGYVYSHLQSKA